ncbi:uncharacterized protein LOC128992659 [Macrosteles quadrilineatus]|uniref:uncharacterized protein LOC128992659 n=1 Tax=Macrosteles quadrilineatus TaxID=74068 RepID=UPI0023E1C21E|nr:uncharacterized protein LOC128992659 [Macrosteles quadrilineatus]
MSTPTVDMSDYDKLGCLHDMFTSQVKKTPNNIAVVNCDGSKTTYKELDDMTDLLANKLQNLGLKKNQVVGILMERCLEYTVAYISILKAGGAYLPIEVSWPLPLVESVLKDATPSVICAKEAFSDKVKTSNVPVILMNGDWLDKLKKEQKVSPLLPPVKTSLDDIAYVVYSSGTTGTPKGILCPHRGAVFSYTWRHRAYPYADNDHEACNVFFVWEMFRPLAKGLPMYIIPDDVIYDPPKLANFIQKNEITRMLFTPSLLQALLEYRGIDLQTTLKSLRQIIYCGEVVTSALRDKVAQQLPRIQQLNLYSISECHDVSNADLSDMPSGCGGRQFCPVGKLFPGVHAVVMDENLTMKPVGEPGEIYIGGPGLAIGYLNRPELNTLRFIPRPSHVSSSVGDRLYRTGDWGYVLSDGSLEICGRCDSMVKIRGYTIEMEAVRLNLLELPGVLSTSVQVYGSEGEEKTLVAFLVLQEGIQLSHRDIRVQLKKKLPFYMIPSRFIILESIPVVEATGKLDSKALASLHSQLREQSAAVDVVKVVEGREVAVSTEELRIAQVWSQLLNLYVLDTEESFFDVGGHSLLAAALASRLSEEFKANLTTADIFKNPTISSQALLMSNSNCANPLEKIDLKKELRNLKIEFGGMDADIRAFWQIVSLSPGKFTRGSVLLTGATGYVGCFLLEELLQHTQTTVYCLVRESPDVSPLDRLIRVRTQNGLRGYLPADRVIPIKGDVSLTNLGLSKDVYSALTVEVDVVIHAAAQVNLILPFSALYNSNVLGTYNALTFAFSGKIKPVHYISTNAVFPDGVKDVEENVDMSLYADVLQNGYGQTKWVAEQLVLEASRKGFPTAVYRCGNVGGSRLVPGWNSADFNLHMLKGVFLTSYAPDLDWQIELTPVDFVSKLIIHSVGNLNDSVGKVFHLINNNTFSCKKLWALLEDLGYKAKIIPFSDWKKIILENSNELLAQLRPLLVNYASEENSFLTSSSYRQDNMSALLKKMNLNYPQLTNELFQAYFKDLSNIGAIPRPTVVKGVTRDNRLNSKVVLVTGASSGIGEGIARTLAHAGATVVLAARRVDKLRSIATELRQAGGNAHAVEMDVCNAQQVTNCIQDIEERIGPIDVLVNNAGVMFYQMITKCDLPRWQHMVDVNVKGVLNCLAAVLGHMVDRGSGHIVNISSDAARKPFPGLAVYSGTKYFVHCLSGALRSEVASSGVKVTDIQPGDVTSELHNYVSDPEAELAYDWSAKVPILKPADVGEAVLYALSQPSHCAINEILLEPQLLPL